MANFFKYNSKIFHIGDTISLTYKLKEGDKERKQIFKGILIKLRGNTSQTKTITIRKISKSGIGVEKIVPLSSPAIAGINLIKKSDSRKAKILYIRDLSDKQLIQKLYRKKISK